MATATAAPGEVTSNKSNAAVSSCVYDVIIYTDGACKGNRNVHSVAHAAGW